MNVPTIKDIDKQLNKLEGKKSELVAKKTEKIAECDRKIEEFKNKLLAERAEKLKSIDAELASLNEEIGRNTKIKNVLLKQEAELKKLLGGEDKKKAVEEVAVEPEAEHYEDDSF